jgi:beta-phosphoglucomutase-like phosphatase (HAD superfamily)
MNNIKTILFDLDGVLLDSTDIQHNAQYEAVLQYCNINIKTDTKYNKIFGSTITTRDKLYYLVDDNIITELDIELIYNIKKQIANKYFKQLQHNTIKIELFKHLQDIHINIGIVTNGNRASALIILNQLGIMNYVDILIANDDCVYHKPFSEPYIRAMLHFKNLLHEFLILEDSEAGLTSARNTGCMVYRVLNVEDVNINLIDELLLK